MKLTELHVRYIGMRMVQRTIRSQTISPAELLEKAKKLTGIKKVNDLYGVALLHLVDQLEDQLEAQLEDQVGGQSNE